MDARGRTWCIDCALAAAGVRTSGRSGRTAASHRRRLNSLTATALPIREVDLRRDSFDLTPGTRPSRLNRELRHGRIAAFRS